jgi:hypothetical protein
MPTPETRVKGLLSFLKGYFKCPNARVVMPTVETKREDLIVSRKRIPPEA